MDETDFWRLFRETGRPEYYLLYRAARARPRSGRDGTTAGRPKARDGT